MKTLYKILIQMLAILLLPAVSYAYVTVSGNVSGQTWSGTNTYYVNGNIQIDNGSTLNIQAGAVVKFAPSVYAMVYGSMVATGTSANKIIFTSRDDNTVGEIIAGSDGMPNPGDWGSLHIYGAGGNSGVGFFDYCHMKYGGYPANSEYAMLYFNTTSYYGSVKNTTLEYSSNAGLRIISSGNVDAQYCTIRYNGGNGIDTYSSSSEINGCFVRENNGHGIYFSAGSSVFTNCQIIDNTGWAARLEGVDIKNYSGNSGSGNGYDAFSIYGNLNQDLVMSSTVFGFPVVVTGMFSVSSGYTLTIPAGEVVKFGSGLLYVYGSLIAHGNEVQPIVFTSFKDDFYGGDLNNDGSISSPAKGDWYCIALYGQGAYDGVGELDHCIFRYGGQNYWGEVSTVYFYVTSTGYITNSQVKYSLYSGINVYNSENVVISDNEVSYCNTYGITESSCSIDLIDCSVHNNNSDGIFLSSGGANIINCDISGNAGWAARFENVNITNYSGNTGQFNGYDAFAIYGSVNQDLTWSEEAIGFPFVITGMVAVNSPYTLTIPAGEVIKFTSGLMYVYGTLIADGTEDDPIVFTSFKDDTYGGDLNNDGSVSSPAAGDWYTVALYGLNANEGTGRFDHCMIRYGGQNYYGELSAVYYYYSTTGYFRNSTVEFSLYGGLNLSGCTGIEVASNTLSHCGYNALQLNNNTVNITNCTITNNNAYGISGSGGTANISGCTVSNNGSSGFYFSSAGVDIDNCEISNNNGWAANLESANIMDYSGNTGSGNHFNAFRVGGSVNMDLTMTHTTIGFPIVFAGASNVANGYTLTIPAGEIIKMDAAYFAIYGSLIAEGNLTEPIVFTSFKDDTYGGDLNADGSVSSPAAGDWYTFNMHGVGSYEGVGQFDHCLFRYGGQNYYGELSMVYFNQSTTGFVTNSTFEYSTYGGLILSQCTNTAVSDNVIRNCGYNALHFNNSTLDVDNCQITNNNSYGISATGGNVNFSDCTVSNNGNSGFYLQSGTFDIDNCEISNNNGWAANLEGVGIMDYSGNTGTDNHYDAFRMSGNVGIDLTLTHATIGFPIVFAGATSVANGYELIIPAGEIVKLDAAYMVVYGSLIAEGTETEPIVFTSFKDDTHGGDLNADGSVSSPAAGDWYTISINGTGSYDGIGQFDHCLFRYGGQNYYGELSLVYFNQSTTGLITNSTFEFSTYSGLSLSQCTDIGVSNNIIRNCSYNALQVNNSTLDVNNCQVTNNSSYGVTGSGGNVNFTGCNVSNNGNSGFNLQSGSFDIDNCEISNNAGWAANLEGVNIQDFWMNGGTANFYNAFRISGNLNMDLTFSKNAFGFPIVFSGMTAINNGFKATFPPGEIIKLDGGVIYAYGWLLAEGTLNSPIVFTSFKDDTYGGDLNHDGTVTSPAPGNWYSIALYGQGANDGVGQFNHCLIRYGGQNYYGEVSSVYYYANTNGYFKNSTVEYSYYSGLQASSTPVVIRNSTFRNNNSYGVSISGTPYPDLGQNSLENGGFNHFLNNNNGGYQLFFTDYSDLPAYYNNWGYYEAQAIDSHIYDDNESGYPGKVLFTPWYDPATPPWEFGAEFMVNFTEIHVGGQLQFTDLTTGNPVAWEWDFDNDGTTDSEEQNPVWSYDEPGLYTVKLTVTNGVIYDTEIKTDFINVGNYGGVTITSVDDVPDDQGGWVYVNFTRSAYDTEPLADGTEFYTVQINQGYGWYTAGYSAAYAEPVYSVICHTPCDSTSYGYCLLNFRVLASMDEGTYVSDVAQGYSVDNLEPSIPSGLQYQLAGNQIIINWNPCPDADFRYFSIYRTDESGQYSSTPYALQLGTTFTDNIGVNDVYFYVITATDFAGNESDYSTEVSTLSKLNFNLPQGWSGISTYKQPYDQDVEHIFAPVSQQLTLLQNLSGMYWPAENINTLINWNLFSGYLVKMSAPATLEIGCTRENFNMMDVENGWNLIPVLSSGNVNVAQLFAGKDVEIVKEAAGWRVYWPAYNVNTLGNLVPGKSYFAKMITGASLVFPEGSDNGNSTMVGELINTSPWEPLPCTPSTHVVAFGSHLLGQIQPGDIIGAFTHDGLCAGIVSFYENGTALTMNGDDGLTPENDGYTENELLNFRIFRPTTQEEFELEVAYESTLDHSGMFHSNALSAVLQVKLSPLGISGIENDRIGISPNPSNGNILIKGLDGKVKITILNSLGESVFSSEMTLPETLDLSAQPAGPYIVKIERSGMVYHKKLIIQ